jgi:hypothetical protein
MASERKKAKSILNSSLSCKTAQEKRDASDLF